MSWTVFKAERADLFFLDPAGPWDFSVNGNPLQLGYFPFHQATRQIVALQTGGGGFGQSSLNTFDADMLDPSAGKHIDGVPINFPRSMQIGDWDKEANLQRLWWGKLNTEVSDPPISDPVDGFNAVLEYYIASGNMATPAYDTALWKNMSFNNSITAAAGVDGNYRGIHQANGRRTHLQFEGLEITIAAYAEWLQDPVSGAHRSAPVEIDWNTGHAKLLDDVYTRYSSSAVTGGHYRGPIDGDSFWLGKPQWVPDSDSTMARPKGRIFIFGYDSNNRRAADGFWAMYFAVYEFNPTNADYGGTSTSRTHWKELMVNRIKILEGDIADGGAGEPVGGGGAWTSTQFNPVVIYFDDTVGRIVVWNFSNISYNVKMDYNNFGRYEFAPSGPADILETPTYLTTPKTNTIVTNLVRALDDLNHPMTGKTVNGALVRVSSEDILDVTLDPPTSQLTQSPLDEGYLTITKNDVALEETTDYTVNYATGLVTWVTALDTGADYLAKYRHLDVEATPAWGTLLNTSAITDERGDATLNVRYPDDDTLVGHYDRLKAETS
jgi:hypothetical protein